MKLYQLSKLKIETKVVWTCHDMWPFCGAEHYTFDKRFETGYLKIIDQNMKKDMI